MTEAVVDKNVPIPPSGAGRPPIYNFGESDIGDSVLVECEGRKKKHRVMSAANVYAKHRGWKFVTRSVEGGVRVWRVDPETERDNNE